VNNNNNNDDDEKSTSQNEVLVVANKHFISIHRFHPIIIYYPLNLVRPIDIEQNLNLTDVPPQPNSSPDYVFEIDCQLTGLSLHPPTYATPPKTFYSKRL